MGITWELVRMWTWCGQALFLVHSYIPMAWSSARYTEGIQWMCEWMSNGRTESWSEGMFECRHVADEGGGEWMLDEWTCEHAISGVSVTGSFPAGTGPWKGGWRYPEGFPRRGRGPSTTGPRGGALALMEERAPGKQLDFFRDIGQAHVWGLKWNNQPNCLVCETVILLFLTSRKLA